jgi:hypothetical protein
MQRRSILQAAAALLGAAALTSPLIGLAQTVGGSLEITHLRLLPRLGRTHGGQWFSGQNSRRQ